MVKAQVELRERWPEYRVTALADVLAAGETPTGVWIDVPADLVRRHQEALAKFNEVQSLLSDYVAMQEQEEDRIVGRSRGRLVKPTVELTGEQPQES